MAAVALFATTRNQAADRRGGGRDRRNLPRRAGVCCRKRIRENPSGNNLFRLGMNQLLLEKIKTVLETTEPGVERDKAKPVLTKDDLEITCFVTEWVKSGLEKPRLGRKQADPRPAP